MQGLTTCLVGRAARIFLDLAYPDGQTTIPAARACFLTLDEDDALEHILVPPLCQPVLMDGRPRGYAVRLGSAGYPHLKLQIVTCDQTGTWVFSVDTHDVFQFDAHHADAARWREMQCRNRQLKERIERAWEGAGLLTFNALLRRGLECTSDSTAEVTTAGASS